jgi:hypothetical protein
VTLIEINFESEYIALALSPINLYSVYPNTNLLVYIITIKCVPNETDSCIREDIALFLHMTLAVT